MFNIGFGELAIICIVLIIAVGPDRLPSMMKTLGRTMRTLRQASRDIRASTGIDELMREDFDLDAPPRRPFVPPPVVGPPPISRSEDVNAEPAATPPGIGAASGTDTPVHPPLATTAATTTTTAGGPDASAPGSVPAVVEPHVPHVQPQPPKHEA
jgi:sec-independent protein translocase protein TatB